METIITLGTVLQGTAISLGMGASTLAILNFFVAIADGVVDPSERKLMGVVYIVLRVAMFLILATAVILTVANYQATGVVTIAAPQATLIAMLFINAILMTKKIMPSKFGPALQASTWYTLGITTSLIPLGIVAASYGQFLLWYATIIVLAIATVNGVMSILKKNKA